MGSLPETNTLFNGSRPSPVRASQETEVATAPPVSSWVSDPPLIEILRRTRNFMERYIVFQDRHQPVTIALWVAHCHALAAFQVTPYLALTAPTLESAKTLTLEVLAELVPDPWMVIQPSDAVVFHRLQSSATLLLDELDTIFSGRARSTLRGILDAGNRRGAAVPRIVRGEVHDFPVFGAKALAGIGELPHTIASRSIVIRLKRKLPHERVARFRPDVAFEESQAIRQSLDAWAQGAVPLLRHAVPNVPDSIADRQAEAWGPVLAVADMAGAPWSVEARNAAVSLSSGREADQRDLGIRLLGDLQEIFAERKERFLPTREILQDLTSRDRGPWADRWGPSFTAGDTRGPGRRMADLLRPFGVSPTEQRTGWARKVAKGYSAQDLREPWARYLPSRALDGRL
jgi:hypothetical protein